MNCTLCGKPIQLDPSAAERAAKDTSGKPARYYTNLFREHTNCLLKKRSEDASELMRKLRDH